VVGQRDGGGGLAMREREVREGEEALRRLVHSADGGRRTKNNASRIRRREARFGFMAGEVRRGPR
jgi:sigma54-dependent transcription regulator